MDLKTFLGSLHQAMPPPGQSELLQSVWHGLKGDWDRAHAIAQEHSGADAAWIHAWIHRIEGDADNARYWYRQAERAPYSGDTRDEGGAIAAELLARAPRR
jgi:hypothetical protein